MSTTAEIVPPLAAADHGRVVEILGPDAQDHAPPGERSQRVAAAHVEAVVAEHGARASRSSSTMSAPTRFIAGEPMNSATKRFSGRS